MVLVVIGALVWHLSTTLQKPGRNVLTFTDFMAKVEKEEVAEVTISRDEITGTPEEQTTARRFRVVAPLQYEGLVNKLIEKQRGGHRQADRRQPVDGHSSSAMPRSC